MRAAADGDRTNNSSNLQFRQTKLPRFRINIRLTNNIAIRSEHDRIMDDLVIRPRQNSRHNQNVFVRDQQLAHRRRIPVAAASNSPHLEMLERNETLER